MTTVGRAKRGRPRNADSADRIAILVRLPRSLVTWLRLRRVHEGRSVQAIIQAALERYHGAQSRARRARH